MWAQEKHVDAKDSLDAGVIIKDTLQKIDSAENADSATPRIKATRGYIP
jgi:hypothetical protein